MERGSDHCQLRRSEVSRNDRHADGGTQSSGQKAQNLGVDIQEVGREQVLAGGPSAFCSEDDTILRISRLVYNFHNSRLLVWAQD
jgi:hypothetical protein